jgi:hypothetical protein
MVNILIAMPCYGGQVMVETSKAVMDLRTLLGSKGISSEWFTLTGESLIPRARNACVAYFLAKSFTHLLFIDSDIVFDPSSVLNLIDKDKDISGGAYPIKKLETSDICEMTIESLNWEKIKEYILSGMDMKDVIERAKKDESMNPDIIHLKCLKYVVAVDEKVAIDQNWLSVKELGTGFLLIKRHVLESMIIKYSYLKYVNDGPQYDTIAPNMKDYFYLLFDCRCVNGRYLSEDYAFCQLARDMGYEIWVDMSICLSHIGRCAYKGNLLLKLANTTTTSTSTTTNTNTTAI